MSNKLGLYIHIPFCGRKCPYCSFYSVPYSSNAVNEYCDGLISAIQKYGNKYQDKIVDTLYFGGGTPSLIGTERLLKIISAVKSSFKTDLIETTLEVNPTSVLLLDYGELKKAGVNRVSVGMQSANENELKILGRNHSPKKVQELVGKIRLSGIDNISLDLMCCIPEQTIYSLEKSIEFCASLQVQHISSYILKLEENTPFFAQKDTLNLPNEVMESELYLFMCEKLKSLGYEQYEISNFSKPGFESKHNSKYWNCDCYLGLGPTAHSFIDSKRFYYGDSFQAFYDDETIFEGYGGDEEEFAMLRLRLSDGINNKQYIEKYNKMIPNEYFERGEKLSKIGLAKVDSDRIALTTKGFLLSNSVISKILWG